VTAGSPFLGVCSAPRRGAAAAYRTTQRAASTWFLKRRRFKEVRASGDEMRSLGRLLAARGVPFAAAIAPRLLLDPRDLAGLRAVAAVPAAEDLVGWVRVYSAAGSGVGGSEDALPAGAEQRQAVRCLALAAPCRVSLVGSLG